MQATDFLRGDVAVKGGITPLIKTAHLAEAFHMNLEVHHGGNSLNNVANLHVILAIPNTEYLEVLLPDSTQKYGLVQDLCADRDGKVRPPDGAGPRRTDRLRPHQAQAGGSAELNVARRGEEEAFGSSSRRALVTAVGSRPYAI